MITHLFSKPRKGAPLSVPADGRLRLIQGMGIEGDVNADPLSPRQILVTRREDLDSFALAPGDLRENVVTEGLGEADFIPGAALRLGSEALVRLTMHCEPCSLIAERVDPKAIRGRRGLLGVVISGGSVLIGDAVVCEPGAFAPLAGQPYQRFLDLVARIPAGRVLSFGQLLRMLGLESSYARALPGYLRKTDRRLYPLHRLVDTAGGLIERHLPGQADLLRAEGVRIEAQARACVDLARYAWTEAWPGSARSGA